MRNVWQMQAVHYSNPITLVGPMHAHARSHAGTYAGTRTQARRRPARGEDAPHGKERLVFVVADAADELGHVRVRERLQAVLLVQEEVRVRRHAIHRLAPAPEQLVLPSLSFFFFQVVVVVVVLVVVVVAAAV